MLCLVLSSKCRSIGQGRGKCQEMSNVCQAFNPLYKQPEGVIGQFDNDSRGSQTCRDFSLSRLMRVQAGQSVQDEAQAESLD